MDFGKNTPAQRWMVKTPEQRFLSELQEGFQYAPRIAQVILEEAKEHLLGNNDNLKVSVQPPPPNRTQMSAGRLRDADARRRTADICVLSIRGTERLHLKIGQIRVILAEKDAPHGGPLRETETAEVTWTVDAGDEGLQVLEEHGSIALRHVRIPRLLDEASTPGSLSRCGKRA